MSDDTQGSGPQVIQSGHCNRGHPLREVAGEEGVWACDGMGMGKPCSRKLGVYGRHSAQRYHCTQGCHFDLCDRCLTARCVARAVTLPQSHHIPTLAAFMEDTVCKLMKEAAGKGQNSRAVCEAGHELDVEEDSADRDWLCDGSADDGGCPSLDKRGVPRFRCRLCNFDLCDSCLFRRQRRATAKRLKQKLADKGLVHTQGLQDTEGEGSEEAPPSPSSTEDITSLPSEDDEEAERQLMLQKILEEEEEEDDKEEEAAEVAAAVESEQGTSYTCQQAKQPQ
eukprot:Sspe_Gene.104785::Locus_81836_Transcript_1_1_Confidence_1.000_Length_902::g.104785::m.104785